MDQTNNPYRLIPRDNFWPLPTALNQSEKPRRTGVEIELAGLSERETAAVVKELWGGEVLDRAPHVVEIENTELGEMKIELDTAWKDKVHTRIGEDLLELSRAVIPVEIVTPPLLETALPEITRLLEALKRAGALGSVDGVFLALGIHLNPEVAEETADFVVPVVRSFAFLERWFRASDPPDLSRRALPFIDPWPRSFIDRVASEGHDWGLVELCEVYLELVPTRNHGLDLLPLLEHLFPDRVTVALPEGHVKGGRPTFHYRLPETRLDEPGWSFAYEWNRWVLIERVAALPDLLSEMSEVWQKNHTGLQKLLPDRWAGDVEHLIGEASIWNL